MLYCVLQLCHNVSTLMQAFLTKEQGPFGFGICVLVLFVCLKNSYCVGVFFFIVCEFGC